MRVLHIGLSGPWTLLAACDARGDCLLLEFLAELDAIFAKDRDAMLQLFERVALKGPPRNTEISHQIRGDIYELIKGRLRVLWFYDEGKVVVCSHGFVKKQQKTPRQEIAQAERVFEAYFAAKRGNSLLITEEEDGEE